MQTKTNLAENILCCAKRMPKIDLTHEQWITKCGTCKKKALLFSTLCDNLILIDSEKWREERSRIATVIICFRFVTGDIITQLCLAANLMEVCCYFTVNLGLLHKAFCNSEVCDLRMTRRFETRDIVSWFLLNMSLLWM